ncbi:MAG TPA: sugar phosphate nucleotidyltransferase [Patescibacteria group bacterium]|nr:sugar phosphate nucleotidyltransferase [Patescibacteria group bacterium]
MRRIRLTITLQEGLIENVDHLVDGEKIRNRSHAIEYILLQYLKPHIGKAVILAGGKGEKLRPYTYELPKPLLPIKGRPILEHLIENLRMADVREIILCVGYLGDKIREYFGDGKKWGVKIQYSEEKTPVGTGGAIKKIRAFVKDDPFLVLHGDILTNLNLTDIINFHKDQASKATVALVSTKDPSLFGQFELHGSKIVGFYERTRKGEEKSYLVNTGVYVFNKAIFDYFPNKPAFMLENILQNLIGKKELSGFVFEDQWFDVGTAENYGEAIKKYISKTTL